MIIENTSSTSGFDETIFTTHSSTDKQETWSLQLTQEKDKIN